MAPRIVARTAPTADDRAAILAPLIAFNESRSPNPDHGPVCLSLCDGEGVIVGGLWGVVSYDWLFIDLLFVPEAQRGRGLGSDLIGRAEVLARERGCLGLWLETFAFQARGFYERLGFTVFGTLEDNPVGHRHYFMRKRF